MASPSKGCEFTLDRAKLLVRFRLWGLWENAEVQQFEKGVCR
jgi:hypothetical protein